MNGNKGLTKNPLSNDLDHILLYTQDLWEELRNQKIFITGGTGFFGCWLLESFVWANEKLNLRASALVLSRKPEAFRKKAPHLTSNPSIQFWTGDVRSFQFPEGHFSHVIHAATESSTKLSDEDPLLMVDTIVQGTRRTLDFARQANTQKFLLTSSGAIYGKQPPEITHITEDYQGGPYPTEARSAYSEGKRAAELLCTIYARQYGIEAKIARCFAFIGPYLPLDIHFAIGNFIHDGLKGNTILVKGDGSPYRSYLYAADLVIWLWTILFRGKSCHPYNVGSEQELTISELAHEVSHSFHPPIQVKVSKKPEAGKKPDRYVPSTQRAQLELNLHQFIDLKESIKRVIIWYTSK